MNSYEALKKESAHLTPEERLNILRLELLRPIVTVQSVTKLLTEIDCEGIKHVPDHARPEEFDRLIQWLSEAGDDLKGILDAMTLNVIEK
ncbi:MAG TPA: hypothetical protein VFF70_05290 [Anaerolineae bacterium]|jgi:hypothetical protein|nr:hypothetical protein [Anaerolineae bacterium]